MFQVKGDIIEYDGKPFAVITAPLSGFRMEAVDAINNYDSFLDECVDDIVKEKRADDVNSFRKLVDEARDEVWLPEEWADHFKDKLNEVFGDE